MSTTFVDEAALKTYLQNTYRKIEKNPVVIEARPNADLELKYWLVYLNKGGKIDQKIRYTKDTKNGECVLTGSELSGEWEKDVSTYVNGLPEFIGPFNIAQTNENGDNSYSKVVVFKSTKGGQEAEENILLVYKNAVGMTHKIITSQVQIGI